MNRRIFITTSTAALAGSLVVPTSSQALDLTQSPLPYAPEALEPHIDAMTMNIHHGKHHAAYIKNLGDALKAASLAKPTPWPSCVRRFRRPRGPAHAHPQQRRRSCEPHLVLEMDGPRRQRPQRPRRQARRGDPEHLHQHRRLQKVFGEAGTKRFGSGWAWLIVTKDGKLKVTSTPNQDNPLMKGIVEEENLGTPILGLDVWEHAYYLKYQNKRPDYIAAWWNVVNWAEVAKGYAAATKA
jgi:Fe-Mn family superoxide dismutase